MASTRLQLRKIEFHTDTAAHTCRAKVVLKLGTDEYTGEYEASLAESPLKVIALATFTGVNVALRGSIDMTVTINLHVAEEMRPIFMEKSLFIIIIDATAGTFAFKPTGAVVAEPEDAHRAIAAAALDSLNRLIQHLFRLNNYLGTSKKG